MVVSKASLVKALCLALLVYGQAWGGPIGIENNNPGNLRSFRWERWEGATGVDAHAHIVFRTPFYGLRAIRVNLAAYRRRGVITPYGIAKRWGSLKASPSQVHDYVRTLCQVGHFKAHEKLDLRDPDVQQALAHGIVRHENGIDPYSPELYDHAFPRR